MPYFIFSCCREEKKVIYFFFYYYFIFYIYIFFTITALVKIFRQHFWVNRESKDSGSRVIFKSNESMKKSLKLLNIDSVLLNLIIWFNNLFCSALKKNNSGYYHLAQENIHFLFFFNCMSSLSMHSLLRTCIKNPRLHL